MILLLAACGQQGDDNGESASGYETMTVKRSDITLEQTYPASIEGRQSIRIIPRVDGYLSEIRIKEGQRVRKGQVLFVIDQATYRAEEKAANLVMPIIMIITTLAGYFLAGPLIHLMGADGLTAEYAAQYLRVFALFMAPCCLYFSTDNYLRVCGKVRLSMTINIVCSVLNIILDAILTVWHG